MKVSILSWLRLAISTLSIFFDAARASASTQCPGVDQRLLLLELRNSLIFDASQSSKLVQWDHQSAGSWSGVTCEDSLVVGLDLSSESISGGIIGSSSLFRLEFLRSLNLAFNNFNASAIPSGLANLTRLVHLDLSNAGFAGQIPAELSRLTKLRTLDLSYIPNPFSPSSLKLEKSSLRALIKDMGDLRELYLDGVNVSAEGSAWCDALSSLVPKLEVLSMSYCYLSGPIDTSLAGHANLSVIQLNGNNLSTTVPTILANFSRFRRLRLSDCGLQGEFPQEVFQVRTLRSLDLSANPLLRVSLPSFPEDSSLETLFLASTNISGRLPDSIGNLRKLMRLELSDCGLSGLIPSSMGNLSELVSLGLSFNHLTGSVPPFGACKNLTQIDISNNNFTGQITSVGWGDLLNLIELDLSSNSLEGDIPPALFALPRLENILLLINRFSGQLIIHPNVSSYQLNMLDLSVNQLQGSIPRSIFKLKGLQYLLLGYNNFSGLMNFQWLHGLGNLTRLDLSYNSLSIDTTVSPSAAASSFPNLFALELESCQLRTMPQFLANQSQLGFLSLSHNYIQGEIPEWIWKAKNLWYLNLSSNSFEGLETLPRNLPSTLVVVDLHSNKLRGNMIPLPTSVMYLDFSNNSLHGSILKSICKIASYNRLEVLDLSHNHLNGTIPDCLVMPSLKILNLRNNQLSGGIPRKIPATCNLKTLDISENFLQEAIPLSLANCAALEIVNIGENKIEGTFPCHLKAIPSLRVLVLRSNKLYGEIGCRQNFGTWQKLQIIDLSSNYFGGTLPASFLVSLEAMKANVDFEVLRYDSSSQDAVRYQDTLVVTFKGLELELVKILTVFTSIDFSDNRLEGPIPETLGDLKALYFLNLSRNAISGSIPTVLGNLNNLESLDLSWNYLNGTIPVQLVNLHFLSFLNLSNNQLVGSIPVGGQFLTFSERSFEGNLRLCGPPLNESCSITTNQTRGAGDDGDNDDGEEWFYIGISLGFVVGFWAICGPLAFIRSWRFAFYRFWDKVLFSHACP